MRRIKLLAFLCLLFTSASYSQFLNHHEMDFDADLDGSTPSDPGRKFQYNAGAAGINHLVSVNNNKIIVQDKVGNILFTQNLKDFVKSKTLRGFETANLDNLISPDLVYDSYNDRWIFACAANVRLANSSIVVGASSTSNPLGAWNFYVYDNDITTSSNLQFKEFIRIGLNKKWVVVTANTYDNNNEMFRHFNYTYTFIKGSVVHTFTKQDLFNGLPTLDFRLLKDFGRPLSPIIPAVMMDSNIEDIFLVSNSNANIFRSFNILTLSGAINSEQLSYIGDISGWDLWPINHLIANLACPSCATSNPVIHQKNVPTNTIYDKLSTMPNISSNVVYRNGSLFFAFVGGGITHQYSSSFPSETINRCSVFWLELNPHIYPMRVIQRGKIDDPSNVPPNNKHYLSPSIAVNKNKDILIGYTTSSNTTHPSAGYCFRKSTDPLGTLTEPYTYKDGLDIYRRQTNNVQQGFANLGIISASCTNPSNDIEMFTLQAYSGTRTNHSGQGDWTQRRSAWARIFPHNLGNVYSNPIDIDIPVDGYNLATKKYIIRGNTSNYGNEFSGTYNGGVGQISPDVFYKFNLKDLQGNPASVNLVELSTCSNYLTDTYIHMLYNESSAVASNDDNHNCIKNTLASKVANGYGGDFRFVVEGYGSNQGPYELSYQYCYAGCYGKDLQRRGDAYDNKDLTSDTKETEGISVVPNPANSYVTIKMLSDDNYDIQLTDLKGKVIQNKVGKGSEAELDLSSLETGLYIVTVFQNGITKHKKLEIIK